MSNPNLPAGLALNEAGYVLHGYQAAPSVAVQPTAAAPGTRWVSGVAMDTSWQQTQRQNVYPGPVLWQQAPAVNVPSQALPAGAPYPSAVGPVRMPQYASYAPQLAYNPSPRLSDTQPLPRIEHTFPGSVAGSTAQPLPAASHLYSPPPGLPAPPKVDLVGKVTGLICSQALKSMAAGSDTIRVQMITLTPGLQDALTEAISKINSACPHLTTQLSFQAETRTISAELQDCTDPDAAKWFLQCYQQHLPFFSSLPTAVALLGRPGPQMAEMAAALAFRGDKTFIRAVLVQQCRRDWLKLFPYVCALDWEVTPGYPQNGRGDTVLTDGHGCYLVIHLKHVSPESGKTARQQRAMKRKTAREHARKYASIFASQRPEAALVLGGYFTNDEGMVLLAEEMPEVKVVLEGMMRLVKGRQQAAAGKPAEAAGSSAEAEQQLQQEEEEVALDLDNLRLDDNSRPSHKPQMFLPVGAHAVQLAAASAPLVPRRQPLRIASAAHGSGLGASASLSPRSSPRVSEIGSEEAAAAAAAEAGAPAAPPPPAAAAAAASSSPQGSVDTGSPREWGDALLHLQKAAAMIDVHSSWRPALEQLLQRDQELKEQLALWQQQCQQLAAQEEPAPMHRQVSHALQRFAENDTMLAQLYDQLVVLLGDRHRLQRKIGQQLAKMAG